MRPFFVCTHQRAAIGFAQNGPARLRSSSTRQYEALDNSICSFHQSLQFKQRSIGKEERNTMGGRKKIPWRSVRPACRIAPPHRLWQSKRHWIEGKVFLLWIPLALADRGRTGETTLDEFSSRKETNTWKGANVERHGHDSRLVM